MPARGLEQTLRRRSRVPLCRRRPDGLGLGETAGGSMILRAAWPAGGPGPQYLPCPAVPPGGAVSLGSVSACYLWPRAWLAPVYLRSRSSCTPAGIYESRIPESLSSSDQVWMQAEQAAWKLQRRSFLPAKFHLQSDSDCSPILIGHPRAVLVQAQATHQCPTARRHTALL
jgi:hypothetical protein